MKKNESNRTDLWDNIKHANLCIIGIPEGEDREKGIENVFEEIMAENFPKLKKETDIQVQETQRVPNKVNPNRPTPRHIIIKMAKVKEMIVENFRNMGKEIVNQVQEAQRVPYRINPRRNSPRHILIKLSKIKYKENILKAAREKQHITHKGIPIRLTSDLSAEALQAGREWQDILTVMKGKNLQPRLLYAARLSFKFDGEIKSFTDKQKLREFRTTKPALQQMLKGLL